MSLDAAGSSVCAPGHQVLPAPGQVRRVGRNIRRKPLRVSGRDQHLRRRPPLDLDAVQRERNAAPCVRRGTNKGNRFVRNQTRRYPRANHQPLRSGFVTLRIHRNQENSEDQTARPIGVAQQRNQNPSHNGNPDKPIDFRCVTHTHFGPFRPFSHHFRRWTQERPVHCRWISATKRSGSTASSNTAAPVPFGGSSTSRVPSARYKRTFWPLPTRYQPE